MANSLKTKKYHFLYKTTNLLNGKYYIGVHSTSNLKDGYLGSGRYLKNAIRKYGAHNFRCVKLNWFNSRELLMKREKQIVTEALVKNPMCMNLMPGGNGGFISVEQQHRRATAGANAFVLRFKNDIELQKKYKELGSIRFANLHKLKKLKTGKDVYDWTGKKHNSETIEKLKGHKRQSGKLNSQYGKPRSEETKQKIRMALLGNKLSEETKLKISNSIKKIRNKIGKEKF